jgi:hypothetical protein
MVAIALGTALAATMSARAAEYQPGEYFNLDLSRAVLSPRPLGPTARFEPVPVEANADRARIAARPDAARPDMGGDPRTVATTRVRVAKPRLAVQIARPHTAVRIAGPQERPRGAARVRLAHRRSNLLDAQAMDTRIQTWPCRPRNGGICNWR